MAITYPLDESVPTGHWRTLLRHIPLFPSLILAMLVVTIVSEPLHVFLSGLWVVIRDGWLRIADTVAG